jgi:two-component system phosphate regulon sensor histidine kinase PhoR
MMFQSRLFWKLFLAYAISLSALLGASYFLSEAAKAQDHEWMVTWGTLAALLFVLAVLVSYSVTRQVTRPLAKLAAISKGLLAPNPSADGPRDEIRTLAQVVDTLHKELAYQTSQQDRERDLSRAVLGCMVESVIVLDAQERIVFLNPAASRLLKLESSEVTGKKLWQVFRHRRISEAFEAVMQTSEPYHADLELELPEPRFLQIQGAQLLGATRGAVLVLHDVTDLRRLERVRQDFFTNVSHELKTPLAAIQATVETLLDGAIDDPKHNLNFLGRINENVTRLNRLVNDLLALSRIESGQQPIQPAEVALESALQACVHRFEHRAHSRRQALQIAGDSQNPIAWADETALDQILDNLVDNAIKYTPEGGAITLKACANAKEAHIEIQDTGLGIAEKDLPRIFERFFRADRARDRQDEGTGLGLSIVKHLAAAQHGRIEVSSSLGRGSQFTVTLPLAE